MNQNSRHGGLAVVTGASSGIGLELAKLCAADGCDLVIAADRGDLEGVARSLRQNGTRVDALQVDLATQAGVDQLVAAIGERDVEALLANAGHGLGHAFLDQSFADARHVIDTNITGTLDLIQRVGRRMRERRRGRILITGSIAGFMPGSFQAVYNGTKAFIDSFSYALRNELKDSGVSVTCLMPGPTDTHFFERADLLDTQVGTDDGAKSAPAEVARDGYDAMCRGDSHVIEERVRGQAVAQLGEALAGGDVVDGDEPALAAGDVEVVLVIERETVGGETRLAGEEDFDLAARDVAAVDGPVDDAADVEITCIRIVGDPVREAAAGGKREEPPSGNGGRRGGDS